MFLRNLLLVKIYLAQANILNSIKIYGTYFLAY